MLFRVEQLGLVAAGVVSQRFLARNAGKAVDMRHVTAAKKRSLDQNRLYHAWNAEVEESQGWEAGEGHRYNKYTIGLAILFRSHPDHRDKLATMLRSMDYADRLAAMDLINCTSQFTVDEMQDFLDAVQRHWALNGVELRNING